MGRILQPLKYYYHGNQMETIPITTPVSATNLSLIYYKMPVYTNKNCIDGKIGYILASTSISSENNNNSLALWNFTFNNLKAKSMIQFNVSFNNPAGSTNALFPVGFKQRTICTINDGFSTWRKLLYIIRNQGELRTITIMN